MDRRVLYGLLLITVALPFLLHTTLNVQVSPQTQALYDAIEELKPGDFVYFGVDWGASTRGENRAQTLVLMRHLMKKKLRFILVGLDPQSADLTGKLAVKMQKEFGYQEGVDWVNIGYQVDQVNFLQGFVKDVVGTAKADIHSKPLAGMPVMNGIRTAKDIKLVLDVTPANTFGAYIQFLAGPSGIPMGLAPTAVMAPEAFVYLDSKQLVGMIPGIQGAAEYEKLLGVKDKATEALPSLSFAHLLIIGFIFLGNVAMILERRQRRNASAEGHS